MFSFINLSKWFRTANSIGNELESKLKQAEEEVAAEWHAFQQSMYTAAAIIEQRLQIVEEKLGIEQHPQMFTQSPIESNEAENAAVGGSETAPDPQPHQQGVVPDVSAGETAAP
jgi:hypothetical protein